MVKQLPKYFDESGFIGKVHGKLYHPYYCPSRTDLFMWMMVCVFVLTTVAGLAIKICYWDSIIGKVAFWILAPIWFISFLLLFLG